MNSKNIIILILVILVLGLGYYSFFNEEVVRQSQESIQTEDKSEDYFARNQDCLKYKNEVTKKLETKDSPFGETSLEQIFYSPKQNSCLYVEYSEKFNNYNRRLLDILNDGDSSTPLEMCSSVYPSEEIRDFYNNLDGNLSQYYKVLKACDDFDTVLEGYK